MNPFRLLFLCGGLLPLALAGAQPGQGSAYTRDQLLADLSRSLQQHFHCEGTLSLDLLRPWAEPRTQAAHWQLEMEEYPGMAGSNMLVRFGLNADGVLVEQRSLMVHAVLLRDVWYGRDPIPSGTTFSPDLLEARQADVFTLRDAVPAKDGDDSYLIARELPAGHVLNWHDLGKRPLVHRGQVVEVEAVEGRLKLKMKALAMENGARGALVTVRNLETRKDISAIVVGPDLVQVQF